MSEKFTKEDLLDIRNCIFYHEMQHQKIYRKEPLWTVTCLPSFYKSMAHYERLLKKIKRMEKNG